MLEVKEVLRLWLAGQAKKAIARQVGLDPKTVRSYVAAALAAGLVATASGVSEELPAKTLSELGPSSGRPRGAAWAVCEQSAQAPPATRCRDPILDAASLRGRGAGLRKVSADGAGARRQAGRGAGGGYRLGAHARAECARQASQDASVDLHAERFARSIRLAGGAGDDGGSDRGLRGGVGILRRHIPRIEAS